MSIMDEIKRCIHNSLIMSLKAQLRPDQQPCRLIYIKPEVATWLRANIPGAVTDGYDPEATSPREQLATITRRFCSGDAIGPPLPRIMNPTSDGIWRFKTPDLRATGWAPVKGVLIVGDIDFKRNCTQLRDNNMMQTCRSFRSQLNINGGSYINGGFDECF
jgi:hypothetical protein